MASHRRFLRQAANNFLTGTALITNFNRRNYFAPGMFKNFILSLPLFFMLHAAAQQPRIDSLKTACNKLSLQNFDQVIRLSEAGVKEAAKQKDSVAYAFFKRTAGQAYYFKGNYNTAAQLYFKAIQILEHQANQQELASAYNELAKLYRKIKKLDLAENTYAKGMAIYKALGDSGSMSTNYNESGVVFEYRKDYAEALHRYQLSLGISERLKDTTAIAYALNNISGVYSLQHAYGLADRYLKKALWMRKRLHDEFALAINYADIGVNDYYAGKAAEAIAYLDSSNRIAGKLKYLELQSSNYSFMTQAYEKQNNLPAAFEFYKKHTRYKDSIFTLESEKNLEELNARYQVEKKDLELANNRIEIQLQQRRNFIKNGVIIVILLFMILGVLLAWSWQKRRRMQQMAETEREQAKQKELRSKAILEAEEKERIRIATDLHDGVGQLLSAAKLNLSSLESKIKIETPDQEMAFKNALSLVDDSVKEVRMVSHNMMPHTLLKLGLASAVKEFITKIQGTPNLKVNLEIVGLNERLEQEKETVLYRVIQEVVSNIIRHAKASELTLQMIRHEKELSVLIEDNGVGFDTSKMNDFEGIGLKNIISRVEFINGTVHFDSALNRGTTVIIEVATA